MQPCERAPGAPTIQETIDYIIELSVPESVRAEIGERADIERFDSRVRDAVYELLSGYGIDPDGTTPFTEARRLAFADFPPETRPPPPPATAPPPKPKLVRKR